MSSIPTRILALLFGASLCLTASACDEYGYGYLDSDDDDGPISCSYEQRRTSCGGSYGDWESRCSTVEDPLEGLTPDEFCDSFRGNDTHCKAGCCVSFQFSDAVGFYGSCDDEEGLEDDAQGSDFE